MDLFIASVVSYWIAWMVYRRVYAIRLQLAVDAHRAAMDQAYDRLPNDEDKMSFLTFCSDMKVMNESIDAEGALRLVAENIRTRRGLNWSQSC